MALALLLDASLSVFFIIYAFWFCFNLLFDNVHLLPTSRPGDKRLSDQPGNGVWSGLCGFLVHFFGMCTRDRSLPKVDVALGARSVSCVDFCQRTRRNAVCLRQVDYSATIRKFPFNPFAPGAAIRQEAACSCGRRTMLLLVSSRTRWRSASACSRRITSFMAASWKEMR